MADNVQIIKDLYTAFGNGDMAGILSHMAPNVVWVTEGPSEIPFTGTLFGPKEVEYFFDTLARTTTDGRLDMTVFVAQGDRVASFGRYAATVNGNRFNTPVAHLFTVQGGKVTEYRNYINTAAASAAYLG